jgi:hypothetical protein
MKDIKNIPDRNPFRVPDNYFKEKTEKIISETSGNVPVQRNSGITRTIRVILVAAASLAIFIMLSYSALHLFSGSRNGFTGEEKITEEYSDAFLNEIDILSLEESVAKTGTFEIEADISKNEIIDYLVSDNIDILDIYEQF